MMKSELPLNEIICGQCEDILQEFPDNCIDLTVTSPPYDNLRDYRGYDFNFEGIAKELYRVTKKGGVVVWVVGDSVVNGSETGNSFRQALYFKKTGFNLHDTMIYVKDVMPCPEQTRYNQCFEYMFVLSKDYLDTFNPIKKRTKGYTPSKSSTKRQPDGTVERLQYEQGKKWRNRFNVWRYGVGYKKSTLDEIAFNHPAIFPEKLARDHIRSWSNEGDVVLDPMCGSGTTCKMAKELNRHYIGIDISEEYCELARLRIAGQKHQVDKSQATIIDSIKL